MKTLTVSLLVLSLAAPVALAGGASGQDAARPARASELLVRPDPWILTKIKAKFAASTLVEAMNIDVDVREGVVYLRGKVSVRSELLEAERLARETTGVRKVDSSGLKIE